MLDLHTILRLQSFHDLKIGKKNRIVEKLKKKIIIFIEKLLLGKYKNF